MSTAAGQRAGPGRALAFLDSLDNALDRITRLALVGTMGIIIPLVFGQVILRYVFARPLTWGEELARYLIIWVVFLAMHRGVKTGTFVGVESVIARLPSRGRAAAVWLRDALILVFSLVLLKGGYQLMTLAQRRRQLSPAMTIPMSRVYLGILIGAALVIAGVVIDGARRMLGKAGGDDAC